VNERFSRTDYQIRTARLTYGNGGSHERIANLLPGWELSWNRCALLILALGAHASEHRGALTEEFHQTTP